MATVFTKALKPRDKPTKTTSGSAANTSTRQKRITIPYISGISKKLKQIFRKYNTPVSLKPGNTLRQKLVHPKDKPPRHKQSNIFYAIKCNDSDCNESYIRETTTAAQAHIPT